MSPRAMKLAIKVAAVLIVGTILGLFATCLTVLAA